MKFKIFCISHPGRCPASVLSSLGIAPKAAPAETENEKLLAEINAIKAKKAAAAK